VARCGWSYITFFIANVKDEQARVLILDKLFQPSPTFVKTDPNVVVNSWPYSQTD